MMEDNVREWMRPFFEEGRRIGLEEGRQDGRQRSRRLGEALALLRLLVRRFGPVIRPAVRGSLAAADVEALRMWTDRVLTATCIEDVADWDSEKEHWTSVYIANQPGPFVPAIENAQVETFDDLLRLLDEDARELKALWADDGRQVGRREGRIEVRKESQREGEAAALLRLLERLFGPIDEAVRGRIVSADEDMLVGWIDRVLTAACLGDVMDQEDL